MPSTQITGEATRILREGSRTVAHLVRVYRLRVQLPSGDSHVQEFAQTCVRVGGQKGNDLVLEDDETQAYVAALEQRHDEGDDDPTSLIEEVERFLRDHDD